MRLLLLGLAYLSLPMQLASEQPNALIFQSGNELLSDCKSGVDAFRAVCTSYILGVVDSHQVEAGMAGRRPSFCLRSAVTAGQIRDVVVLYLEENPALRDQPASLIIIRALEESFTC